jgi:hypothetical protein
MNRVGMFLSFKCVCAVALTLGVLAAGSERLAAAQTKALQTNVGTSISCAPSQNGTGHMICGEELQPGGNTVFGGASWQAQPTVTGAPGTEAPFTTHFSTTTMPAGPFTGTPGCASTGDGTGVVICAVEGPNNGLYGIAIHPQPTQTTSALMPLLIPGTAITTGMIQSPSPCSPSAACNIVGSLASAPSCAQTSAPGNMVICAVVVNEQNVNGSAQPELVGIAFDPRKPVVAGSNPAIATLPYTFTYASNPSCVGVTDHSGAMNAGAAFAACGIAVMNSAPWSTPTFFGVAFDPRSGFSRGGLIINSSAPYVGDPSCATPRDGSSEVICAIGTGTGSGFGSATFDTLTGFGFDPVARTTTPVQTLSTAPSSVGVFLAGVGCASPNKTTAQSSVLCALTTTANQTFAVLFDPRIGGSTVAGSVFTPPSGAAMRGSPSCISLNIVNNSISCGIVDANKQSWAFSVPSP